MWRLLLRSRGKFVYVFAQGEYFGYLGRKLAFGLLFLWFGTFGVRDLKRAEEDEQKAAAMNGNNVNKDNIENKKQG